jgi:hypothetical protein
MNKFILFQNINNSILIKDKRLKMSKIKIRGGDKILVTNLSEDFFNSSKVLTRMSNGNYSILIGNQFLLTIFNFFLPKTFLVMHLRKYRILLKLMI